ncbi:MAG: M15 family metallopeptidase [Candidatus Buchananbacteria bacterium]
MKTKKDIQYVDLFKYGFIIEPRYFFYSWSNSSKIFGRKSAVEKLVEAKKLLPKGYNFKIWDCLRERKTNILMQQSFKKRLKLLYPNLSNANRLKLLVWFCGSVPTPLRVVGLGTHRNGGSFDLTIINKKGEELYMGTGFDDLTEKAALDFFENKSIRTLLEDEAFKNRKLLKKVMNKVGFINYAPEWWHWSYNK